MAFKWFEGGARAFFARRRKNKAKPMPMEAAEKEAASRQAEAHCNGLLARINSANSSSLIEIDGEVMRGNLPRNKKTLLIGEIALKEFRINAGNIANLVGLNELEKEISESGLSDDSKRQHLAIINERRNALQRRG
ncbi:MAG: hypothetical protein V1494_02010 [Candidatus Diapherotrites archaeon]